MKKTLSKIVTFLLTLCMIISLFSTTSVHAKESEQITLEINGTIYENVQAGLECIIGDVDIDDVEIKVVSVNNHTLQNVGTKSGVLDSQGRTVLEYNCIEQGDGIWMIRLCYHDVDDPVEANHGYGFDITGIILKKSNDSHELTPTVSNAKNVKLTSLSSSLKLTWKKTECSGYEIQYSTSNSKISSAKKIKVKSNKTKYTIKNLKSNTKYYVRIRTYKKYTDALGNSKTIYGKWISVTEKTKK